MSNLVLRFITASIIGVCTLAVTFWGGISFRVFCFCVGLIILYEWLDIISSIASARGRLCAWLSFMFLGGVLFLHLSSFYIFAVLLIGASAVYGAAWQEKGAKTAFLSMTGFVYAALFPISLILLREGLGYGNEVGLYWTLFLYIAVWFTDIGAYACGRLCGGAKLAANISPNKTWSGAIGGEICAVIIACCFVFMVQQMTILEHGNEITARFIPFYIFIAVAALLSFTAQMGDLGESFFKRRFKVKDSGRLLPGHGGVMDRIDGLLPAAFLLVCILSATHWAFP